MSNVRKDVQDTLQVIYVDTTDATSLSILLNRTDDTILIKQKIENEENNIALSVADFLFFVDHMKKDWNYQVS